jgi:hypothetical protein
MKLSRRTFLRGTAVSAAGLSALALTGCRENKALNDLLLRLVQGGFGGSASVSTGSAGESSTETGGSSASGLSYYRANVLTGEGRGLFASDDRIVGVMINNISNSARQNARPQRGLSAAKILIESKVEGGITRFCALYDTASAIPEVGPIRSGRDQFLQLIMPWNALYYHDGESIFCTQFINVYDYSDYNLGGKNYFDTPTHAIVSHRDSRDGVVAYEHTEFTSGTEIRKAVKAAGLSLEEEYDDTFFRFADYRTRAFETLDGCEAATQIEVRHSDNYRTSFVYSASEQVYKMRQYSAATKTVTDTVDELNGQQLEFANVLVCFAGIAAYPGDSADVQSVEYAAGGDAYLFTGGKVKPCRWQKEHPTAKLRVFETGSTSERVCFNMGKTYIGIVDDDEREQFLYSAE